MSPLAIWRLTFSSGMVSPDNSHIQTAELVSSLGDRSNRFILYHLQQLIA
jgi:hypothetical protein